MLGRRGVTLIELLIVVTIIVILAGMAIPYVQGYLDESRVARAKTDLDEIRNSLARFELTRGQEYTSTGIASLVGPFLSKVLIDPWGGQYYVAPASSTVRSRGPDGQEGGGDDLIADFRPPMAVSDVYWVDSDQNGAVNAGDGINLKMTRPGLSTAVLAATDFTISSGWAVSTAGAGWMASNRIASYTLSGAPSFTPGSDTLTLSATSNLLDGDSKRARQDTLKIKVR